MKKQLNIKINLIIIRFSLNNLNKIYKNLQKKLRNMIYLFKTSMKKKFPLAAVKMNITISKEPQTK